MRKTWYCLLAVILIVALCMTLFACKKKTEEQEEEKKDVIDEPINAEGIALNWQEVLLVRGTSIALAHTVSPDGWTGTTTYTSSDTEVATVNDQGLVSGLKPGVATVTAKIDDDHYAECRIIVGDIVVAKGEAEDSANTTPNTGSDTTSGTGDTASTNDTTNAADGEQTGQDNGQNGMNGTQNGGTQGSTDGQGGTDNTGDQGTANDTTGDTAGSTTGGTTDDTAGSNGSTNTTDGTTGTTGGMTSGTAGGTTGGTTEVENATETTPLRRTISGGVAGTSLFTDVQSALTKAKDGDVIVIDQGDYKENVSVGKKVTVMGVNNPKMQQVTVTAGAEVTLQNITVITEDYPAAGEAAVIVKSTAKATIRNCVITCKATGTPEGGYGILVEKQSQGVRIVGNSIGNFRYGIYICPTDQSVTVTDNKLSNMAVGIGLDVRQENADTNYPTLGKIGDNEYNEVTKHTQFLHYGENYEGDFDFADNEEENTSNGNSETGGSGLLE